MATKFLLIDTSGNTIEKIASVTSSAALDNLIATDPVTGKIDSSMMPSGIGTESIPVVCSEALTANDMINLYNNAGTLNARKADASSANQGKAVDGFVKTAFASGATATVFTDVGAIASGFTGLTVGSMYFLGTTGTITATRPTTSGNTLQKVGKALSATQIIFDPETPVTLA